MKRTWSFCLWGIALILSTGSVSGQETKPQSSSAVAAMSTIRRLTDGETPPLQGAGGVTVPRLIKFSETLQNMAAKPVTGAVEVTFSIYREQAGGEPLWFETQRVEADELGHYTVLLGAMSAQGVPAELFTSGEARWLGVQVGNLPETAQGGRILLVSVPYALKALDAETLGGKPASVFQLVAPESPLTTTGPAKATGGASAELKAGTGKSPKRLLTSGNAGYIGKFINSTDLGNSELFDTGTTIGLGTTTPAETLDVTANNSGVWLHGSGTHQIQVTGATSGRLGQDSAGFFFASDTSGAALRFLTNNGTLNERMRITSAGNVTMSGSLCAGSAVCGPSSVVGGGAGNIASGGIFGSATVAGGSSNTASGQNSTVAGGQSNTASGAFSTIAGGGSNTASGLSSTVAGGASNAAIGNQSTVAGGVFNTARGDYSFAAGCRANAVAPGTFVWSGNFSGCTSVSANAMGEFVALAPGGVIFYSNTSLTAGVTLAAGGSSWKMVSDRNLKRDLARLDGNELLAKINRIPMSSWSYKSQDPSIRHMGPMAQDFYAAFRLGEDDKHIEEIDGQGVALAGVQALYRLNLKKDRQIQELRASNRAQQAEIEKLRAEVRQLRHSQTSLASLETRVERLEAREQAADRGERATRSASKRPIVRTQRATQTELARLHDGN